jgi:hypothetical protein
MIQINCKDSDNLRQCVKYGACPKEQDEIDNYCNEQCKYNTNNIEFNYIEEDKISIKGCDDLKCCIYNTMYNYRKCGIAKENEDCTNCRYWYENIKQ